MSCSRTQRSDAGESVASRSRVKHSTTEPLRSPKYRVIKGLYCPNGCTYSGGGTIFGSTYFSQGPIKASSALHRFAGSSSNILSIKSNADFGKLKNENSFPVIQR